MKKILILLSSIILVSITSSSVSSCELNHSTNNLTPLTPATPVPKKIPLTPLTPARHIIPYIPIKPGKHSVPMSNLHIFKCVMYKSSIKLDAFNFKPQFLHCADQLDPNTTGNLDGFTEGSKYRLEAKINDKYLLRTPVIKIKLNTYYTYLVNDCLVDKTISKNIFGGTILEIIYYGNHEWRERISFSRTIMSFKEDNLNIMEYPI